jgi:hypothetical protein
VELAGSNYAEQENHFRVDSNCVLLVLQADNSYAGRRKVCQEDFAEAEAVIAVVAAAAAAAVVVVIASLVGALRV